MASIGDLFFTFRGDDGQLQVDASKAGDKAGQTLGQRLSAGAKTGAKAGLVGLGAGAGALFGIAAKGGAELTETVAKYRAETGATAEEAEAAQASIGKLYRNNIAGFETLGAVLASVKTNLGLTGAEGEKAAQRILDFAKVTGQDAVVATGQLDDIMDSLNLSYEQGSSVLDQLVASQQKFGGSVDGNAAALAALAPALNAANLSVDDGIGLLNLFAVSGIDAADAPAALTKALTKVESPAELQKLIDDINATQDPFERAAKASDLFGAKAGAKLANALDGVDFKTFVIGATEAGGAVQKASDVIDASPYNRLKLALKQVAGPLADVGTKFGPLILGFSQLGGPKLIAGVTGSLGALGGKVLPGMVASLAGLLPALGGTLAALGSGIGGLIAAAIPIGMALLPVLLVAALVAAVAFLIANPEIVGKIAEFAGNVLRTIVDVIGKVVGFFAEIFGKAVRIVGQAVGNIIAFIVGIPGKVVGWVAGLVSQAARAAGGFLGAIGKMAGDVVGFVLSIPGKLAGLAGAFLRLAGDVVKGFMDGLVSLPGKVIDFFANMIRNIRIDIGPFHISGESGITIDLPSFAVGTPFVPRDMLALVHAGEMIIPAATSDAIRAGRAALATRPAQGTAPSARALTVNVYNPKPEPASTSTKRELQKLAAFGVLA